MNDTHTCSQCFHLEYDDKRGHSCFVVDHFNFIAGGGNPPPDPKGKVCKFFLENSKAEQEYQEFIGLVAEYNPEFAEKLKEFVHERSIGTK